MISDINDPVLKKADDSSKEKPKDTQAVKATVSSTPVSSASFYGQKTAATNSNSNVQSNTNTQSGWPNTNAQSNEKSQIGRVNKMLQSDQNTQASMPPPLPKRDGAAAGTGTGSTYTVYAPPGSTFADSTGSPFREPELVKDDENMPGLTPAYDSGDVGNSTAIRGHQEWGSDAWASGSGDRWPNDSNNSWDTYDNWDKSKYASNTQLGPVSWLNQNDGNENVPPIDGRNSYEERRWWHPEMMNDCPGRGMLPPLLVDMLHNPDHTLLSVNVSLPDITPVVASSSGTTAVTGQGGSSPQEKTSRSRSTSASYNTPPTAEEVREAVPHPHAYYCRRHNGWILLSWDSSNTNSTLLSTGKHTGYLDPIRRNRSHNCLENSLNKTHHFHRYSDKIDAWVLSPPYKPRSFEKAERAKQVRRRLTVGSDDLSSDVLERAMANIYESQLEAEAVTEAKEEEGSAIRLDMYFCCQCLLSVACSEVIPGVIPPRDVEEFNTEKSQNPQPGKTPEKSVHQAWETVLTVIENKLWKCNDKSLSVNGKSFSSKIGWSKATQKIFTSIGFSVLTVSNSEGTRTMLNAPNTDPSSEEGKSNREKLLRAWVEIGAMVTDHRRRFPNVLKEHVAHTLWVKTEVAREQYQLKLGAHPDQIKRNPMPDALALISEQWLTLGMTSSTYDPELLHFAYLAQKRCDLHGTPEYFQALCDIVDALTTEGACPTSLQTLVATERSNSLFTLADLRTAYETLGFGAENSLRVEYGDDVDDEFLTHAWRDALRQSWHNANVCRRNEVNEAFRWIAMSRHSKSLVTLSDEEAMYGMTPEKAYQTLEVPQGVDEEMLITVYNMRVEDQPSSLDRMREAMRVIAEVQGSDRLRAFLKTGTDPGTVVASARPDWPRGLNQLGNTCYLNSLLQYFYTIKDLREAIAPLAGEDKFMDNDKFKDDDLKNHRVGGRIVSRHEVVRSRKFVSQLANLFWHMENGEASAVTPSLELAKLALITSKDEEEDDPERGTDSSHSTDATLVDEPAPNVATSPAGSSSPISKSPSPSSPSDSLSVLGKRPRGFNRKKTSSTDDRPARGETPTPTAASPTSEIADDVDIPDVAVTAEPQNAVASSSTPSLTAPTTTAATTSGKAPPLPPRPKAATSDMMFGKQHDVAECMDNCMFQMETALLRFGELGSPGAGPEDSSKRSIVKRLFYGKIRQRLSVDPDVARKNKSSIHEREDYFSHLPVNVSEESFDLYDGLSGYFDDTVEYEGAKARMEVSLVELPPIMQIQLQRVQFNRETLQPYKSHAYVKFGSTISMDRFLDDAPAEKKAKSKQIQQDLNSSRERLSMLTHCQGKHEPYDQALLTTSAFINAQCEAWDSFSLPEADLSLASTIKSEADRFVSEIQSSRAKISELKSQLEELWQDETRARYVLTSVFVHRGASPSFGHYFIYQRKMPRPSIESGGGSGSSGSGSGESVEADTWFKYNDSEVSVVSADEVFADTTGSTANPYLLVFTRETADIIDTVHRSEPMLIE